MITEEMEDELYSFVVDTNQEWALINGIKDSPNKEELKKAFIKWFQLH